MNLAKTGLVALTVAGAVTLAAPHLALLRAGAQASSAGAGAAPSAILSGNIGCIQHLQSGTATPVRHWVEVLDDALGWHSGYLKTGSMMAA